MRGDPFLKSFFSIIGLALAVQCLIILSFAIYPKALYYRAWEYFVELADKTAPIDSSWKGPEYGDLSRNNFFYYQDVIKTSVSTDKDGFRSVPLQSNAYPIVVAGASDVFGSRLSDDETLPWLIAENTTIPTFNAGKSDIFRTLSRPDLSSAKLIIDVVPEIFLSILDPPRQDHLLEYKPIASNTYNYFEGLLKVSPNHYLLPFIIDRTLTRILKDIQDYYSGDCNLEYLSIRYKHKKEDIYTAARSILKRKQIFNNLGYNYMFVADPGKQTLYADDVDEITRNFIPQLSRTLSALGVDTADLATPFMLNKQDGLHFRYDSHWNGNATRLGAKIISQKILNDKKRFLDPNLVSYSCHLEQSDLPRGEEMLFSVWGSPTVYGESLIFIKSGTGNEISASLLFKAKKIIKLTNSAKNTYYLEGQDYKLSPDCQKIILLPDSRIPVIKNDDLYRGGHIIADENISIFQVRITYARSENDCWKGYLPRNNHSNLPRTREKLNNKRPIALGIIGDSIAAGWNSSKHMGFPPYQPSFAELFVNKIKNRFGIDVNLVNYAEEGTTTLKGVEASKRIAEVNPDLVIIAYGLNDAVFSLPAKKYVSNIQEAISCIKRKNPHCEFIIVASSLGNPEVFKKANKLVLDYATALQALSDTHTAIADMSRIWEYLLTRKKGMDITGNCYNHPNDFGHALYAEGLFSLLSD